MKEKVAPTARSAASSKKTNFRLLSKSQKKGSGPPVGVRPGPKKVAAPTGQGSGNRRLKKPNPGSLGKVLPWSTLGVQNWEKHEVERRNSAGGGG